MNRFFNIVLCVCCLPDLLASLSSHAQEVDHDPAVVLEKFAQHVVVQADGTYVQTSEEARRIGRESGIKASAQQYISFNASLQTVDVLEAYTQKADGRKIPVGSDNIRVQQEPRSFSAPMFQDTQYKVVIFPDVAVQDLIYLKFRRTQKKPLFPGFFEKTWFPGDFFYKDCHVVLDLPASMPLHYSATGFNKIEPVTVDGRTRHEWTYASHKRPRPEAGAVAYADYGDKLYVSTFADYAAFARAYQDRATDKAAVTPKIEALAKKLTGELSDPREKAKALHNWVRKNIRYVAVYIGPGGVVPHAAEAILDNLYGDCKDHATLLEALLTAAGIESTPALINLGSAYRLPAVPAMGVINHVITYVPSLDLYMDSTAEHVDFGYLPEQDLDKPVILTKSGTLAKTPARQARKMTTEIKIKADAEGGATFTHAETHEGMGAEVVRALIKNQKPSEQKQVAKILLQRLNLKGDGKVDTGNLDDTGSDYRYGISGQIESLANFPGPVGIPAFTSFGTGIWQTVTAMDSEKGRKLPFVCPSQEIVETTSMEFPESISISKLPAAVEFDNKQFHYRTSYTQNKNTVTIKREYRSTFDSRVCTAEDFSAMIDPLKTMRKDLSRQILVEAK